MADVVAMAETFARVAADQAELDRLVESAQEHHDIDCTDPTVCAGLAVAHVIGEEIKRAELKRLLNLAVAQIACLKGDGCE